jgi:hypothetical protein
MTYELQQYPELYLDYVNNFLTVERFANYYGITEEYADEIISAGRQMTKENENKYLIEFIANGELQIAAKLTPAQIQQITKIIKELKE